MSDLLQDLLVAERLATGNSPRAAELYRAARLEIERCHARLEIDHWYVLSESGQRLRKEAPWEDRSAAWDAVSCRDETIKLLQEQVDRMEQ